MQFIQWQKIWVVSKAADTDVLNISSKNACNKLDPLEEDVLVLEWDSDQILAEGGGTIRHNIEQEPTHVKVLII